MRRVPARILAAVVLVLVLAVVAVATSQATPSSALGGAVVQPVNLGGDLWWNFDFVARNDTTNVDWPVDVIFWGNATVSKVYNKLGWAWPGSNVYQQVSDGAGTTWVASAGRKNTLCTDTHLRLYADSDGALSNPILGSYVVGTAHLDVNECSSKPSYGWNETAEGNVAARWAARWGSTGVVRDAAVFPDKVTPTSILANVVNVTNGTHVYVNNGLPTLIYVP